MLWLWVVALEGDGGEVTHAEIKSAIKWQAWALVGLAGIGAWALHAMGAQLDSFQSTVGDLRTAISANGAVMQDVAVKLERIDGGLKRVAHDQLRHESEPASRAHADEPERRR